MKNLDSCEWFHEIYKEKQCYGLIMDELLYRKKSKYQDILVFRNEHMGNVLVLDGAYMLSDLDEHMYHKALTSYGMQNLSSDVQDLEILVIGAGDGGVIRDLFKNYDSRISKITMVEIDEEVIEVSKKFFPKIATEFKNPKLDLRCEDALAFIKNSEEKKYDLVFCDSTDPVGFAAGLIEEDFYKDVRRVMKDSGIFIAQSGSPFFQKEELEKTRTNLGRVFQEVHTYYAPMIVYPGVIWSYTAAGRKLLNHSNIDLSEFIPEGKFIANHAKSLCSNS
jgi:spermidine synthase